MGREGSWGVLLGCLRWMRLLLATLEAWSWSRSRSRCRSLGGGGRVVLELLLLLWWLWGAGLGGSRLSAVSRVLHAVLRLWRGAWLLGRVPSWSLVLLVHLTIHACWGSLLYSSIGGLRLGGHSWLRGCR